MEDLQSTEHLLNEKDCCIICLKKLTGKKRDHCGRGCSLDEASEKENLPEVAPKSVVTDPGFLRTFNRIRAHMTNKRDDDNGCDSGGDCGSGERISLETVIYEKLDVNEVCSEAPTICERCCDKVVAVENLMKAMRQQVREIRMIWDESRRKGGVPLENLEHEFVEEGQPEKGAAGIEVKEEEDGHWQESADVQMVAAEDSDECAADNDAMDDDQDDDSNWAWEDEGDDPDYIKSEQEDSDNDDDEELTSEEELDEEPLTLEENQNGPAITGDPLEINFLTERTPKKMKQSVGPRPGPSSSSSSPNQIVQISCDVKGCNRKFISLKILLRHKKKCHTVVKAISGFTCDLEACTRTMPTKEALRNHKMSCHRKLWLETLTLDPKNKFPCSCGRKFPTEKARYQHQRKNVAKHPDFQFKWREYRNQLAGGQPCDMCGEPVKLPNILEHLTSHVGAEYVVKCPNFEECGHAFTHVKDFTGRHVGTKRFRNCRKICDEIKFGLTCETCGFTTDNRIRLATHVTFEHERGTLEKNLNCPISSCEKMFATKQSIFLHLHVHRYRRKVLQNCDKCGEDIKVEGMEGHLKDKHGILEIFGCKQCPFKFPEKDGLVEHLWEHKDAGLFCDICGDDKPVKYLKYGDFREHYFGVHNLCPKKYKCGDCENKWFWRNTELCKHEFQSHQKKKKLPSSSSSSSTSVKKRNDRDILHKCENCGISFVMMSSLISHNIRVHGEDPFRCDSCGKTFTDQTKFNRHKKEHAGMEFKKEWKCEVEGCGKIFGSKINLKNHKDRMHVSEKLYVCEDCGKEYAVSKDLRDHRNSVHLGIRPWICEECGEGFAESRVLKRHKLIHTGERPFGCEICGQRFRQSSVLKRHVEGHEKKGSEFKPNGPMKQIRKRKAH